MYDLATQLELPPHPTLIATLADTRTLRSPHDPAIQEKLGGQDLKRLTPSDFALLGSHIADYVKLQLENDNKRPEAIDLAQTKAQIKMASWLGRRAARTDEDTYDSAHKYLDNLKLVAPFRSRMARLTLLLEKYSTV